MSNNVKVATQLTAPGASDSFSTGMGTNHTIVALISSIDTTVVLRIEGTLDGTNWFNLSEDDSNVTSVSNGAVAFSYTGMLHKIRGYFVSETGGTAALISFSYLG